LHFSVILRCERKRASKDDGPSASAGILRGPLSRPPQDDGEQANSVLLATRLRPSHIYTVSKKHRRFRWSSDFSGGGGRFVTIVAAKNVDRMERSVIRVDSPARTPLPDFAALHPGYEER
jgi:hypothetical protein